MRRAVCPESLNNTSNLSCFHSFSDGLEMETDANICFLVNFLNIDKWAMCIPKVTFYCLVHIQFSHTSYP